ncbi:MAG: ribosome silencing factor [Alphaproteobacteria bacterium]
MNNNTQIEVTIITQSKTPAPPRSPSFPPSTEQLLALILASLDDDQAGAIHTIPMAGKSPMADYLVVASGTSSRHVASLADHLQREIKQHGGKPPRIEGRQRCDWVLVDAGDIVVHLFRPEVRDYYNLEKLWDGEGLGTLSTANQHQEPQPESAA